MKNLILAALVAAIPVAAQAQSTRATLESDPVISALLELRAHLGDPDCRVPVARLSLLELAACKEMIRDIRAGLHTLDSANARGDESSVRIMRGSARR